MGALDQMRERVAEEAAKGPKRSRKIWTPPDTSRFRHGTVMSFDQTLTHTGVAIVTSNYTGLSVLGGTVLDTKTDLKGFEATYAKAEQLERLLAGVMFTSADTIVHEMPAVQGHRIESALMAGREVRRVAAVFARGVPVVAVSNQSMRVLLNPPEQRYEKKYVRQAVEALIPPERRQTHRWNEHVHDAVGLALTHLYEKETP